ncbi:TonB-dependent receptor [Pedobacter petrophilus]|uniref:TonB-dependent receptor n=1 Tax=Pedobacter petrophilus TaxID=1908241 RepID=A0A7K0FYN6_9SPHI|nr:TonB-dependent receptor [Pedobacter petrophilus]MRX75836.1 TonB-dependent receptor [Pedobacter petrophilus]
MKIYLSLVFLLFESVALAQEIKVDTAKANDLNEVVVTGQYGQQSLKNSIYNVRTIDAEKIRLRAATNLQQVLNTELGFRFSNDLTLGTTDVSLMGMSGRNVKILLDGVPMVDRSDARESLGQIDINTVDRIEIIEGPMSVTYGSDALAGVINIITKNAGKSLLSLNARVQEETAGKEYAGLTDAGLHNQNLSLSWQNKGWNALAGVSHQEFGGWNMAPKTAFLDEFNQRKNQWKPKEQWLGNTKVGYRNENFNIWYRLDAVNETIDARFGINPNTYEGKLATYTTKRYTNQLQSEWKISQKLNISAIAGYTDLQRSTQTVNHNFINNTEKRTTGAGEQDTAKFNTIIFRTTAVYKMTDMVSFQPGFEFNRDAATGQRISGSPVINDLAFFISSEIKLNNEINIRPGLRVIKNSIYNAPIVPSLNTKFQLSRNLDLRLGYAKGFRSPALRELYYDFVDASHSIYGNTNLKAEQSNSYNGSLVWSAIKEKHLGFRTTLAGFLNKFKNKIDFGLDPSDNSRTTLLNISNFKTVGTTLDNNLTFKNLNASIGVSYIGSFHTYSEDETFTGKQILWSPEVTANLTYAINKINANVSIFYKYTGEKLGFQTSTGNATLSYLPTKISSFSFADLMVNKTLYKSLLLTAGVKNIFNITQLNNTSTASGGAHSTGGEPVPLSYGRSYVLGLSFNWNKI